MKRKKVVVIGGGTGSFTLLSGLKKYPVDISAVVSMVDDGGSTGILRDELGVLPPGDARQCLVALSDSSEMLRELMNYRFAKGGLKGHSFGNIFLSALEKINGNFAKGVEEAAKILNVKGEVMPVADEDMRLMIRLKDGSVLKGEKQLDHNIKVQKIGIKNVYLQSKVKASQKVIDRIKRADLIVIGPGDLYGSILPNLLVKGISEAIRKSKAKVVYNCNLTNKKGQTEGFDLDRYVTEINKHIGFNRIDFVVFNNRRPPRDLITKYERREGKKATVEFNERKKGRQFKVIRADLLKRLPASKAKADLIIASRSFIRHDSDKLARVITMIMEMGDYKKILRKII